jgi:hypothetical protein
MGAYAESAAARDCSETLIQPSADPSCVRARKETRSGVHGETRGFCEEMARDSHTVALVVARRATAWQGQYGYCAKRDPTVVEPSSWNDTVTWRQLCA